jgi:hypothetical protein
MKVAVRKVAVRARAAMAPAGATAAVTAELRVAVTAGATAEVISTGRPPILA